MNNTKTYIGHSSPFSGAYICKDCEISFPARNDEIGQMATLPVFAGDVLHSCTGRQEDFWCRCCNRREDEVLQDTPPRVGYYIPASFTALPRREGEKFPTYANRVQNTYHQQKHQGPRRQAGEGELDYAARVARHGI